MNNLRYILTLALSFVLFVSLQVFVLDNIQIHRLIFPIIYIAFLILLPFSTPHTVLILLCFVTGMVVDLFQSSIGANAIACLFIGFVHPFVKTILEPRNGYEAELVPSINEMGFQWFLTYAGILILIFNIVFYFIDAFTYLRIEETILKIILSSIITLVLLILQQILFNRN